MFILDERLQKDTVFIGRLPLSQVLLMNDSRYIWLILVPARNDVYEVYHLDSADQMQLAKETSWVLEKLAGRYSPDSMNIGALGNIVKQLHVHHIVRFKTDFAWPGPVWGNGAAVPYSSEALEKRIHELKSLLAGQFVADINGEDDPVVDNYAHW